MRRDLSTSTKLICVGLVLLPVVLCIIAGWFKLKHYNRLTAECTAQVEGVVEYISGGRGFKPPYGADEKYISTKGSNIHISVETDGVFKYGTVYAARKGYNEDQPVVIHYSPEDPDVYYIDDRIEYEKTEVTVLAVIGGLCFAGAVALAIALFKKKLEN